MCARLSINWSTRKMREALKEAFAIETDFDYELPKYNIAPSMGLLCVIHDGSQYRVGSIDFGYSAMVWDDRPPMNLLNAKVETIWEKPSFQESIEKRRCIVLANGYFEWDDKKQPFYIHKETDSLLFLAGIYQVQVKPDHKKKTGAAILTTAATPALSTIHPRMPLLFDLEAAMDYLNPKEQPQNQLLPTLQKPDQVTYQVYPVTRQMSSPSYQMADCIQEIKIERQSTLFQEE